MGAIPLRKEDAFPTPVLVHSSPAHPAAPAIEERARKAAAKAPAAK